MHLTSQVTRLRFYRLLSKISKRDKQKKQVELNISYILNENKNNKKNQKNTKQISEEMVLIFLYGLNLTVRKKNCSNNNRNSAIIADLFQTETT